MTNSRSVADTALALTFDTAANLQHVASDLALTVSDTYRLKPLKFWGLVGAAVIAIAATVAVARR
ncbi:MAG: hypothetical protein ACOH1U_08015 [Rhodoglobus sp.]